MKKMRCPYFELNIYAFMQSVGLVNDHARFCFRYKELRKGDGATKRRARGNA